MVLFQSRRVIGHWATVSAHRPGTLFPFPQRDDYLSRSSTFLTLISSIAFCASSLKLDSPSLTVTLLILR